MPGRPRAFVTQKNSFPDTNALGHSFRTPQGRVPGRDADSEMVPWAYSEYCATGHMIESAPSVERMRAHETPSRGVYPWVYSKRASHSTPQIVFAYLLAVPEGMSPAWLHGETADRSKMEERNPTRIAPCGRSKTD